jgi:hypothetical protein
VLDHVDEPNDVWMSKLTKRKDFITESFKIKSRYARLDNLYSEDLLPGHTGCTSVRSRANEVDGLRGASHSFIRLLFCELDHPKSSFTEAA